MGTSKRNALEPVLGRWHSQNLAVVALPVNADIPAEIDASLSMRSTTTPGRLAARGIVQLGAAGVAAAVAG
jgi:xanthine dehydrogenase YagR molybdenum-binding subunit